MESKKDIHIIVTQTQHNKLKKIKNKIKRETQITLSFNSLLAILLDCIDIQKLKRKIKVLGEVTDIYIPSTIKYITHCDTIILIEDGEDIINCPICNKELHVNEMEIKYE